MELSGQIHIDAPLHRVWGALNDPALLARCIEGVQSLEQVADSRFEGRIATKIGPVRATFDGIIELTNLDPPKGYTLVGEGKGGAAGFARGKADVKLVPEGNGTMLAYTATALTGGKLAQFGARLVEGAARQMADRFFTAFKAELEVKQGTAITQASSEIEASDHTLFLYAEIAGVPPSEFFKTKPAITPSQKAVKASRGVPTAMWSIGLALMVLALLWWQLKG